MNRHILNGGPYLYDIKDISLSDISLFLLFCILFFCFVAAYLNFIRVYKAGFLSFISRRVCKIY